MNEQPTLWEGVIPIISSHDLRTVTGRALAKNHEDGRARLILDVSREDAEMLKIFLENQQLIGLSWLVRPLNGANPGAYIDPPKE